MAVGWYSKNIWNLCSWKWGQSRIMWELSSRLLPQRRHVGSTAGLTFDLWYLKKLWPVRCLMQRPRSFRFWSISSLESLILGDGKNIFVWRHSLISSHRTGPESNYGARKIPAEVLWHLWGPTMPRLHEEGWIKPKENGTHSNIFSKYGYFREKSVFYPQFSNLFIMLRS